MRSHIIQLELVKIEQLSPDSARLFALAETNLIPRDALQKIILAASALDIKDALSDIIFIKLQKASSSTKLFSAADCSPIAVPSTIDDVTANAGCDEDIEIEESSSINENKREPDNEEGLSDTNANSDIFSAVEKREGSETHEMSIWGGMDTEGSETSEMIAWGEMDRNSSESKEMISLNDTDFNENLVVKQENPKVYVLKKVRRISFT